LGFPIIHKAMASSTPPSQTTLLIGGSNGTATLCAILGDRSNPLNANHTLRVATRSAKNYLNDDASSPRVWRCSERKHISDLVSADFLPTRTLTHVGAPNSVFVYGGNDDDDDCRGSSSSSLSQLERAISGVSAPDDGGIADVIILACPVSAHLSLLKRIARALYNLDAAGLLGSSTRPPILIGTLYGAGGFDWQSRVAFYGERPDGFVAWKRPLGLFALKAFPYLCKSLKAGEVTLHGRFPQIQVAVTPSNAHTRRHAGMLLDRVLQTATTGKSLEFLGLCADEKLGGDGTVGEERAALLMANPWRGVETAASARNAMMIAAQTHKQLKQAKEGGPGAVGAVAASVSHPAVLPPATSNDGANRPPTNATPTSPALDVLLTQSLSDHADPKSSLGFLTCTLNSTNQILHPCILVALFGGDGNVPDAENDDGTITWNPRKELTPLPRFYADGAAKPLAGELITAIAGGEMYFVIDALERLLSPRGYDPITALHGG